MKHPLITTIAAVLLVGCGTIHQSVVPAPYTYISIHQAAMYGSTITVNQHLSVGTDVNAKDEEGGTPLHFATGWNHKKIVELLIDAGADVDAKTSDGGTPLIYAAQDGYRASVILLLAGGAHLWHQAEDVNVAASGPGHCTG